MFRATPMMRISAVILERDERTVLESLGDLGAVQLTRSREDREISFANHYAEQRIVEYDRLRLRIEEVIRVLEIPRTGAESPPQAMAVEELEGRLQVMEGHVTELVDLRRAYRQRQKV